MKLDYLTTAFAGWLVLTSSIVLQSAAQCEESKCLRLTDGQRRDCVEVLRIAVNSDEFWPSMHAAEAMTLAGLGDEVRQLLIPRLATETDGQHRCGLARELVRAGDRKYAEIMFAILKQPEPYAHTHACESLYKVNMIGDGELFRAAMQKTDSPKLALMAAAGLARWGNLEAFAFLRRELHHQDGDVARIAAWILARIGNESDIANLQACREKFRDSLAIAYFDNALAALGDRDGLVRLAKNLSSPEPAIRTYAATFAGDARATNLKQELLQLLNDTNIDVRIRAAQSLLVMSKPAPPDQSAELVLDVFSATEEHPRNSEGSVIALRDGSLLLAVTEFVGGGFDHSEAQISACRSNDAGLSWSKPRVLQENVGKENVMSVTLRRLERNDANQGPIGMFFLVKNSVDDLKVMLRVSHDECKSFGPPVVVTDSPGYHVMNNDRVTLLKSGRILVPVASTVDSTKSNHYVASCFISDDQGKTWRHGKGRVDYAKRGAMEPDVLELRDGRLLMIIRTQLGHVACAHSADGGDTWSDPKSWGVRAPEAPATLRRIPSTGDLMLVWNDTFKAGAGHGGKRTPLTIAISRDEGETWKFRRNIEESEDYTFSYISLIFDAGRAVLTYYVRDESTGKLSLRFRSIPIGKLYDE